GARDLTRTRAEGNGRGNTEQEDQVSERRPSHRIATDRRPCSSPAERLANARGLPAPTRRNHARGAQIRGSGVGSARSGVTLHLTRRSVARHLLSLAAGFRLSGPGQLGTRSGRVPARGGGLRKAE